MRTLSQARAMRVNGVRYPGKGYAGARRSRVLLSRVLGGSVRALFASLILGVALGCAAKAPPPKSDPKLKAGLEQLLKQRQQIRQELSAASEAFQTKCRMLDGDCLLFQDEKRSAVVQARDFPQCGSGSADEQRRCQDDAAAAKGEIDGLVNYYEWENWCTAQVLECTARLEKEQQAQAIQARAEERRQQIATSPEADALELELEYAQEKLKYLRGTLPVVDDSLCTGLPAAAECEANVAGAKSEFEAALQLSKTDYDAAQTLQFYKDYRKTEVGCYEPEYQCMLAELTKYGASPLTQQWLDKNLDAVRERQALLRRVPDDAAQTCLDAGVSKYQDLVMSRYEKYLERPGLQARAQLDGVFLLLHKTQLHCLRRVAN